MIDETDHTPIWLWRAVAGAALVLYLAAATYQLRLPGLNYDEALDAAPAAQVVLGQPTDGTASIELLGRRWPLMTMPYIGVTTTYLLIPIFKLLGIGVLQLRGAAVFVGALSLLLSWGFLRRYFDERVAAISLLLLGISPSFVFWTRMGAWVQLVLTPITISAFWLLFAWYTSRRSGFLVAAWFMLGLGLATHIRFAWIWGALAAGWLMLSPWLGAGHGLRRWLWPWQRASAGAWALSALAALLGMTPLILYNSRRLDLLSYTKDVVSEQQGSFATEMLVSTFRLGLNSFVTFLSGDWFRRSIGATLHDPLIVAAFALAVLIIALLALMHRLSFSTLRTALLIIVIAVVVAASVALPTTESPHHLILLWPMPQALIAVALFGLGDWLSRRAAWESQRLAAIAVTAPMVVLVVAAGWTTLRYHRALAQTGGIGVWTDAIYQVATDLDQPGAPHAFAADWGFRRNLQIITQNRVDPLERFDYSASAAPNLIDQFVAWTDEAPDGIYLFHAPGRDSYPGNRDLFEEAAYRNGRVPTLVKTYFQRDGRPAIQTYVLKPYTPTFEIPPPAHTTDVQMGDSITLVGYDLSGGPGSPSNSPWVTLYWRADARPQGNYKVFAHLLDSNGNLRSQHDSAPVYATHPTTGWARGEMIADRFRLPIPEELPAGTYPLFIGMYDEATGERLPLVVKGERLRGDTLRLTDVTIE